MSSNIREVLKEEAKRNPEAIICVVRAFAIALIIMFMTPNSCSIISNAHGARDYVVIWADDVETFKNVYRMMRGLIPNWNFDDYSDTGYPPPLPPTTPVPVLPGVTVP